MMSSCLKLWLWSRSGSWGQTAGQMELMADRGLHRGASGQGGASRLRVLTGFFLSSRGATCGRVLHLMMLKAACVSLEVLSISECYFCCSCFNIGLQVGKEE